MAIDRPAADQHRLAQIGLTVTAREALENALALLDVHRLRETMPEFTLAVAAIVHRYSPAASVLAIRHYLEQRAAAGVAGTFRPETVNAPPMPQIASNVRWATQSLWGPSPDVEATQTNLEGAVGRLIQNVGRETTINAVQSDRQAVAWAREARPDACWWCAMLATRGAVYSSASAAGRVTASDPLDKGGLGIPDAKGFVNRFHDHCHCEVVPVFNVYEKPAHARDWTALWNSSTRGVSGMEAMQAAFRTAYNAAQAS